MTINCYWVWVPSHVAGSTKKKKRISWPAKALRMCFCTCCGTTVSHSGSLFGIVGENLQSTWPNEKWGRIDAIYNRYASPDTDEYLGSTRPPTSKAGKWPLAFWGPPRNILKTIRGKKGRKIFGVIFYVIAVISALRGHTPPGSELGYGQPYHIHGPLQFLRHVPRAVSFDWLMLTSTLKYGKSYFQY